MTVHHISYNAILFLFYGYVDNKYSKTTDKNVQYKKYSYYFIFINGHKFLNIINFHFLKILFYFILFFRCFGKYFSSTPTVKVSLLNKNIVKSRVSFQNSQNNQELGTEVSNIYRIWNYMGCAKNYYWDLDSKN